MSRAACFRYVWNQIEHGVGCPTGMTYAAYPGLSQPEFGAWRRKSCRAPTTSVRCPTAKDRQDHRLCHDRETRWFGSAANANDRTILWSRPARAAPTASMATSGSSRFPQSDGFFTLAQASRGRELLLRAGLFARRLTQRGAHPAAEGQVRQSLQRVERDRVSRCVGLAGRGGRPRHPRNPLARPSHAIGFCHRLGRIDAAGPDAGAQSHRRPAKASVWRWQTSR